MSYVNFNRTKPASFALSEYADRDTIYFTTDTHDIIVNGKSFGGGGGSTDLTELYELINNLEVTHTEDAEVISAALNDLNRRLLDTIDTSNNNALNYKKSFVFGDYIYLDGYYVKDSEVITVTTGVYDESTETITVL